MGFKLNVKNYIPLLTIIKSPAKINSLALNVDTIKIFCTYFFHFYLMFRAECDEKHVSLFFSFHGTIIRRINRNGRACKEQSLLIDLFKAFD